MTERSALWYNGPVLRNNFLILATDRDESIMIVLGVPVFELVVRYARNTFVGVLVDFCQKFTRTGELSLTGHRLDFR